MSGLIENSKQIAESALKEFLEHELGDYSFHWSIDFTEEIENKFYFDVCYGLAEDSNLYLNMRVTVDNEVSIEIEMSEDDWKLIERFSERIKYFWMLVKWE